MAKAARDPPWKHLAADADVIRRAAERVAGSPVLLIGRTAAVALGHDPGWRSFTVRSSGRDACRVKLFSPPDDVFAHPRHEAAQKALPDLIVQLPAAANVRDGYELQQELIGHIRETDEAVRPSARPSSGWRTVSRRSRAPGRRGPQPVASGLRDILGQHPGPDQGSAAAQGGTAPVYLPLDGRDHADAMPLVPGLPALPAWHRGPRLGAGRRPCRAQSCRARVGAV
jgi:hypothetical protein